MCTTSTSTSRLAASCHQHQYIHIHIYLCIYICRYRERDGIDRDRETERDRKRHSDRETEIRREIAPLLASASSSSSLSSSSCFCCRCITWGQLGGVSMLSVAAGASNAVSALSGLLLLLLSVCPLCFYCSSVCWECIIREGALFDISLLIKRDSYIFYRNRFISATGGHHYLSLESAGTSNAQVASLIQYIRSRGPYNGMEMSPWDLGLTPQRRGPNGFIGGRSGSSLLLCLSPISLLLLLLRDPTGAL